MWLCLMYVKILYIDDILLGENMNCIKMCFRWGQDYNCLWELFFLLFEGMCGDWLMKNSSY